MFIWCIGVCYLGVILIINWLMNFFVCLIKLILILFLLCRSWVLFFLFRLFCMVLNEILIFNYFFRYCKEFNIVVNFFRLFWYLKIYFVLYIKKRFFFFWVSLESSLLFLKMYENLCLYIVWSFYWIKC